MDEVQKQMFTSLQVRYQGPILNDTGLFPSDVEFSHSFDYAQVRSIINVFTLSRLTP